MGFNTDGALHCARIERLHCGVEDKTVETVILLSFTVGLVMW